MNQLKRLKHFTKIAMLDDGVNDGVNGDFAAGDGVYSAQLVLNAAAIEYYVYAENADAGQFFPARAEHEFMTLNAALVLPQGGQIVVNECSMAKLFTSEMQKRTVDTCLQFFGGYGYIEDYPICRAYRDVRVGTIAGGTSEIMREIIAKIVVDGVAFKKIYQ